MSVKKIESLKQFKAIIGSDTPSVFDFWATWCGPCRMISPIYERLASQYTNVNFYKVDVDALPEVSQEAGVRAMPTFISYRNGNKVSEVIGANPQALNGLIVGAANC